MHRSVRPLGLLFLAALLAGCLSRGPTRPAFPTMQEALGKWVNQPVTILYQESFDEKRQLVLFRTDRHPGPSPTLLERTGFGRWRVTDSVGLHGELPRAAGLSYSRASLGRVYTQLGTVTTVEAETHVVFGEVLDPAITWVKLTLHEDGAEPIAATVANGLWLVKVPPQMQNTWFVLEAGDDRGRRTVVSLGKHSRDLNAATTPLTEYQDAQFGIRLQHPVMATPRTDPDGRLTVTYQSWTIGVERRPPQANADPEDLLDAAVAEAGERVLDQGLSKLGPHPAAYLLEFRPEADGKGASYHLRYLVPAEQAAYEVSCVTRHIHSEGIWEEHLRPFCDRILSTVELGR